MLTVFGNGSVSSRCFPWMLLTLSEPGFAVHVQKMNNWSRQTTGEDSNTVAK
jgi:hypothetical protein